MKIKITILLLSCMILFSKKSCSQLLGGKNPIWVYEENGISSGYKVYFKGYKFRYEKSKMYYSCIPYEAYYGDYTTHNKWVKDTHKLGGASDKPCFMEDSLDKGKVFLIDWKHTYQIYDFGLKVGDSSKMPVFGLNIRDTTNKAPYLYYTVTKKYDTIIHSVKLKKWKIRYYDSLSIKLSKCRRIYNFKLDAEILEKVGILTKNSFQVLWLNDSTIVEESGSHLALFCEGNLSYPDSANLKTCIAFNGIEEEKPNLKLISFYYNALSNEIKVDNLFESKRYKISVFDLNGRQFYYSNAYSNSFLLGTDLKTGIYICKIEDDKGNGLVKKFIISK